jgi:putative polyhydroxyalkanoate system protein
MSRITVEREHTLGKEAARAKAEQIAERLASDFGVQSQWQGDTLELTHSGANGSIEVGDDKVTVDLRLSMLLAAMSGMIRQRIERSLEKALSA